MHTVINIQEVEIKFFRSVKGCTRVGNTKKEGKVTMEKFG